MTNGGPNNLFSKIRAVVRCIPKGKVTTYGRVAREVGILDARIVGWAMHSNKNPQVPCHRVLNRKGKLADNYGFGGWQKQKEKLEKEGITFKDRKTVNLEKHLWRREYPKK